MQKLLRALLPLFFAGLASPVFSQFSIGPRAGIHYSTWVAQNADNGFRSGPLMAAVAEIRLNNVIAFQGEVGYIQKGFRNTSESDIGTFEEIVQINGIEIPLLFRVGGGRKFRFDGLAGLGLHIALNGTYSVRDFGIQFKRDLDFEADGLRKIDLTLNLGGGLSYQIADQIRLFTDIRLVQGLGNVYTDPSFAATSNTGFSFSLGGLFQLKKNAEPEPNPDAVQEEPATSKTKTKSKSKSKKKKKKKRRK